ncbi:MAG: hypothetical protein QOG13_207 [Sphingomonadales bacterium]|nr:hypothetical protein [Sphingomonadales bacterium]
MMASPIRKPRPAPPAAPRVLQRKCACGARTASLETCPACAGARSGLQRMLSIGSSNDPLEREADRVAEQVISAPARLDFSSAPLSIQRRTPGVAQGAQQAPASVDRVLASSGRPLDAPLRRDMETRLGHDFSQVRVHDGSEAGQSARDVGASAYTVGNHLVFGAAQFQPGGAAGRRLLAHELVHVVQQEGMHTRLQRQSLQATGTGGPGSGLMAVSTPAAGSVPTSQQGVLQESSYEDLKEGFYSGLISMLRTARKTAMGALRGQVAKLPKRHHGAANALIKIADGALAVGETLLLAVIGLIVGFLEGIVGLIKGVLSLVYGIVKLVYDLISGIFTNFEDLKQDWNAVVDAVANLPTALMNLIDGWFDQFSEASPQRRGAMIGELVGQIVALIATFAASAARAGSVVTVVEAGGELTTTATSTFADVVSSGAKLKQPLTTVTQGGGKASAATELTLGERGLGNALKEAKVVSKEAAPATKTVKKVGSAAKQVEKETVENLTEKELKQGATKGNAKPKSPNQINEAVKRGQAPEGIGRVDVGKVKGEQVHIVVNDGALNIDGTWKHVPRSGLTSAQRKWLAKNGWKLPE